MQCCNNGSMNKLVVAVLLLSAGCGTIFNKRQITVRADDGVTIDGSSGSVTIDQGESHTVGYPDGTECTIDSGISVAYFIVDLFLTGPVGIIVDAVTGGWKISKSDCHGIAKE
jgi:hypothetical protein